MALVKHVDNSPDQMIPKRNVFNQNVPRKKKLYSLMEPA